MLRLRPVIERIALLVLVTVLLAPTTAASTSVIQYSDEAMVALSDRIVEGTAERVTSAWNADRTQIHTTVMIRVTRTFKGEVPRNNEITFRLLGGQVGDDVMELVGGPTFEAGQDVIVFLDATAPTLMPITGLFQGKFTVQVDPDTGARIIRERRVPVARFVARITDLIAAEAEGDR